MCKALDIETTDNCPHTCPSQCMKREISVLWNQEVYTDREVAATRPDIIIKIKK